MDDSSTAKSDQVAMDDDVLLEQGSRALQQLTAQAEVARAEARRAELEWILQQARKGQTSHLRQWLKVNQPIIAVDQGVPLSKPQETSERWDRQLSVNSDQSVVRDSAYATSALTVSLQTALPSPSSDRSIATTKFDAREPFQVPSQTIVQPQKPVAQKSQASRVVLQPSSVAVVPNKRIRRLGGVMVSIIAHVLLVLALGFITIKLPVDGSIFALEASSDLESITEDFEMSSPVQVDQPTELPEPTKPVQESNFPQSLADIGEPVSEIIDQAAPVSSASQLIGQTAATAVKSQMSRNAVTFYGAAATGNSFCFVIDGSGSMKGGPWEAARNELLRCIGALKPSQRFHVIFFNKEISVIPDPDGGQPATSALYATTENKSHAQRWLESLQIAVGAPPIDALELALEIECDGIYFLADGEMSDKVAKRLLEILREKNRTDDIVEGEIVLVPIHTIAYYSDKGLAKMKAIAEENRGQFAYVPKPRK